MKYITKEQLYVIVKCKLNFDEIVNIRLLDFMNKVTNIININKYYFNYSLNNIYKIFKCLNIIDNDEEFLYAIPHNVKLINIFSENEDEDEDEDEDEFTYFKPKILNTNKLHKNIENPLLYTQNNMFENIIKNIKNEQELVNFFIQYHEYVNVYLYKYFKYINNDILDIILKLNTKTENDIIMFITCNKNITWKNLEYLLSNSVLLEITIIEYIINANYNEVLNLVKQYKQYKICIDDIFDKILCCNFNTILLNKLKLFL